MLFGFGDYDCTGGSQQFIGDFDSLLEIQSYIDNSVFNSLSKAKNQRHRYWDIMDIKTKITINYDYFYKVVDKECRKTEAKELIKCLTVLKIPKDIRRLLYYTCYQPYEKKIDEKTGLVNYIIPKKY